MEEVAILNSAGEEEQPRFNGKSLAERYCSHILHKDAQVEISAAIQQLYAKEEMEGGKVYNKETISYQASFVKQVNTTF